MNRNAVDQTCPLCEATQTLPFYQDTRDYFRCAVCELVFVLPKVFLSPLEEKTVYDHHENSPQDSRYRQFLSRIFEPLSQQLATQSSGLDFGSGPGPTLNVMFEEAGHRMEIYDPFYSPDSALLQRQYDFITATEVVEHLHHPRLELDRLWACLKPNGLLGIMTKRVDDLSSFSNWHYKNDPTHVCFFSLATFRWLAKHWDATLTVPEKDVVIFQRSATKKP